MVFAEVVYGNVFDNTRRFSKTIPRLKFLLFPCFLWFLYRLPPALSQTIAETLPVALRAKTGRFFNRTPSPRLSDSSYSILVLRCRCKDFRGDPLYLWASTKGGRENPPSCRLIIRCSSLNRPQAQLRTLSGMTTFNPNREHKKRICESFIPGTFSHWSSALKSCGLSICFPGSPVYLVTTLVSIQYFVGG